MKKYVSGKEYLGLVVGEEEVMDPFFFPNNREFFDFTNTEAQKKLYYFKAVIINIYSRKKRQKKSYPVLKNNKNIYFPL